MSEPEPSKSGPWQPFSFSGVARLSKAPLARLFVVQAVFLAIAGLALASFLTGVLFPAIKEGISQLPAGSSIQNGELRWPAGGPSVLAENRFVSLLAETGAAPPAGGAADFQFLLRKNTVRISSLFGFLDIPYPGGWRVELNRSELEPLWGAWHPLLLAGLCLFFMAAVEVSWILLGVVYAWIPRMLAFYFDRPLSSLEAWKLSVAALMPGALFMSAAIGLYALGRISLVLLLIAIALHFLGAFPYLAASPFWLKRAKEMSNPFITPPKRNPFAPPSR